MRSFFKRFVLFVTELLFPPRCPGCDEILTATDRKKSFCKSCLKNIKIVGNITCMKCGRPLKDATTEYCSTCAKTTHIFDKGYATFQYFGPMKSAMYRLKYSNKRCYCRAFAKYTAMLYRNEFSKQNFDAIIPVPMYKKKEKARGYNQAAVIAKALSKEFDIPILSNNIHRIVDTKPMKGLNPLERKENIQNAFKLSENTIQLNKVLIVDDIYTTGSTMDAISAVLKQHKVASIYCFCMCIGEIN